MMNKSASFDSVLSHGTVECSDLDATRTFYEDFLGLTVIQPLPMAIYASAGGGWQLVCVRSKLKAKEQGVENRFCLHVGSESRVVEAHVSAHQRIDLYQIRAVGPLERVSDVLRFILTDRDHVRWEISAAAARPFEAEFAASATA